MIVAGVMSGTSADGINVALVSITDATAKRKQTPHNRRLYPAMNFRLLGHAEYPYAKDVRKAVLASMNANSASVAHLSRLNFLLAELYADAVVATQRRFKSKAELIGCHGQTLYHQGEPASFLRRKISATWQAGEGSVVAARLGVPVVCDFRPADVAAGGKGAPLVPFLDYALYRDERMGRIVQNIGGIANLTAIPAGASPEQIVAFDTGPGNMLIDGLMERLYRRAYDEDGQTAISGTVVERALEELLKLPFFRRKPPKTAGREEFGREFVRRVAHRCGRARAQDVVATATALTARSIAQALQRFVIRKPGEYSEYIVSGGGAKNPVLMAMLANQLRPLGLTLRSSDEFGLPAEAKEAVAFAILAYETWMHRPSNIPSATGAHRPAILGKICYV